jgi:hypothetical protein
VCAICNEPINGGGDMHEALVTRGDVTKRPYLMYLIMAPENCVLLHRECHTVASTEMGQKACARHLLAYEGKERILTFLKGLLPTTKGTEVRQAINLIEEILECEK